MYKDKKIIGIIPARGGSKGLPRKNILPLLGKPLIAWTIEQAHASKYLDKVIISTDDDEIAEISKQYGAQVPFMRPQELASDTAKSDDVMSHAIEWLESKGMFYDLIVKLQPTSPNRSSEDIDNAIELLFEKNARSVVSICEAQYLPQWSNILPEDGCLKDFMSRDIVNSNRQEFPTYYRLNGAVYLAYCYFLKTNGSFLGAGSYAYIMPRERSIDIDDEIDFKFAECLLERG